MRVKAFRFHRGIMLECLQLGAEKFGWSKRNPEVGSMKRDGLTLGWGVAGAAWIATRDSAAANVELRDDGTARVACGAQDIGTGTYTVLALLTADKTGVPVEKVEVVLGDTALPLGPVSGGSLGDRHRWCRPSLPRLTTPSIRYCRSRQRRPDRLSRNESRMTWRFENGRVFVKADGPGGGVPFADLLKRANLRLVTGSGRSEGIFGGKEKPKFSMHSFGCHFVEVTWQPEIARLRVNRVVTVIDAGRIINPLAGRNQIEGAVVMGIGMALLEAHALRPAKRRADQQQPGRLHGGSKRRRAEARSAFPRLSRH